jgi:hypothetical protein
LASKNFSLTKKLKALKTFSVKTDFFITRAELKEIATNPRDIELRVIEKFD